MDMNLPFSQRDILQLENVKIPVIVLSKNAFNCTNQAIVCPLFRGESSSATHVPVSFKNNKYYAASEQLRYLDLSQRFFKNVGSVDMNEFIEISNAAESLIDYY